MPLSAGLIFALNASALAIGASTGFAVAAVAAHRLWLFALAAKWGIAAVLLVLLSRHERHIADFRMAERSDRSFLLDPDVPISREQLTDHLKSLKEDLQVLREQHKRNQRAGWLFLGLGALLLLSSIWFRKSEDVISHLNPPPKPSHNLTSR